MAINQRRCSVKKEDFSQIFGLKVAPLRHRSYSQHISDDADRPHVRGKCNCLKIHDLWCDELGRAKQHLKLCRRIVFARQTKVDDLDAIAGLGEAQNVLGLSECGNQSDNRVGEKVSRLANTHLQVEVDDVVLVDVVHRLADLSHENRTSLLGEEELVVQHAIKQLAAVDAVNAEKAECFWVSIAPRGIFTYSSSTTHTILLYSNAS
jgi:uncharacterized transporter YbjL